MIDYAELVDLRERVDKCQDRVWSMEGLDDRDKRDLWFQLQGLFHLYCDASLQGDEIQLPRGRVTIGFARGFDQEVKKKLDEFISSICG